jgi:hypothetical protein
MWRKYMGIKQGYFIKNIRIPNRYDSILKGLRKKQEKKESYGRYQKFHNWLFDKQFSGRLVIRRQGHRKKQRPQNDLGVF